MSGTTFERVPGVLFAAIGEDVVALNVERGYCYSMEQVTATIWDLLAEPSDLEALCARLEKQYDVQHERCRSDVVRLLDEMVKEGLVKRAE